MNCEHCSNMKDAINRAKKSRDSKKYWMLVKLLTRHQRDYHPKPMVRTWLSEMWAKVAYHD